MTPGLVRHAPLVTPVSDRFRELIVSGRWPVGGRIPCEHELARELGVSRATVREALRGLSIAGLLEPRVGDGTYVHAADEITGVLGARARAHDSGDLNAYAPADADFHRAVVRASGNPLPESIAEASALPEDAAHLSHESIELIELVRVTTPRSRSDPARAPG